MLASRLIGTTVVSQNNETIGDVNDILFDRNGQVMAAVVGVGGFLGIGEKDVAVPFQQMDFVADTSNAGAGTTTTAAPSTAPTTTGSTAGTAATRNPMPNRVMLKMTKSDLQAAPTFEEYDEVRTTVPSGNSGTMPPRQ